MTQMRSDKQKAAQKETSASLPICRRSVLKLAGGFTLSGVVSSSSVVAQSGNYPDAFDSPLVHEQLWLPDRPEFTDDPVHEQLWIPDRPAFTEDPVHEQLWVPDRPEFLGEPVYTEIWGEQTGPGDITGSGDPATDPDDDGLYEDINGDGEFDVFDVQALYNNLDTDAVQNNPELFDFSDSGGDPSIFDVQALYNQLP